MLQFLLSYINIKSSPSLHLWWVTFLLVEWRQDAVVSAHFEVDLLLHALRYGALWDYDADTRLNGAQDAAVAVEDAASRGDHSVALVFIFIIIQGGGAARENNWTVTPVCSPEHLWPRLRSDSECVTSRGWPWAQRWCCCAGIWSGGPWCAWTCPGRCRGRRSGAAQEPEASLGWSCGPAPKTQRSELHNSEETSGQTLKQIKQPDALKCHSTDDDHHQENKKIVYIFFYSSVFNKKKVFYSGKDTILYKMLLLLILFHQSCVYLNWSAICIIAIIIYNSNHYYMIQYFNFKTRLHYNINNLSGLCYWEINQTWALLLIYIVYIYAV